eukprot:1615745-Prymnesium_polylepis.1
MAGWGIEARAGPNCKYVSCTQAYAHAPTLSHCLHPAHAYRTSLRRQVKSSQVTHVTMLHVRLND